MKKVNTFLSCLETEERVRLLGVALLLLAIFSLLFLENPALGLFLLIAVVIIARIIDWQWNRPPEKKEYSTLFAFVLTSLVAILLLL